jgi:hypothetical protein
MKTMRQLHAYRHTRHVKYTLDAVAARERFLDPKYRPIVTPCDGCELRPRCEQGEVCKGFLRWVGNCGITAARKLRGVKMQSWAAYCAADSAREIEKETRALRRAILSR